MDILSIFKEYGLDVGSVAAIVVLTRPIRMMFNIPNRFVPVIPIALGFILGVLNSVVAGFGDMLWYQIVGGILKQGIVYGGVAMGVYNVWKKTVKNK